MSLRLHNTLTRRVQSFEPLRPPAVGIYVCGPTVYDVPHIGHARSAYIFDMLRRCLASRQYDVTFVRNVTDVDDKIIQKAKETGEGEREVAVRYLKSYHEAMDRLGIERPTEEPHATQHVVPEMTDFIAKLLVNGVAYEAGGDVYFSVRKATGYGGLSNRTLDDLQAGARVEPAEHKQDPLDFALWKAAKPGEPSWKSPWGPGRPGWHIECSSMSTTYLGDAFDIHGGGVDLVFPHHENELAQAREAGKPFARYWVHNGLLTVNGEKMSKSLRNYITVEDALKECGGESDILKTFFLGTHYRSPIDYSSENVKAATKRYKGLLNYCYLADVQAERADVIQSAEDVGQLEQAFVSAMDDDLNTPQALAVLDKLANLGYQLRIDLETVEMPEQEARSVRGRMVLAAGTLRRLSGTLGLLRLTSDDLRVRVPDDIKRLVLQREEARKRKDYRKADVLRTQINELGYVVEDVAKGPSVILPKQ